MTMRMTDAEMRAALRLQSWLSPAFPVGAYSYSHGVEAAIEDGLVRDPETLRDWIAGLLEFGSGRTDAILLAEAWRLGGRLAGAGDADAGDAGELEALADFALALIPTAELRLEATSQGAAFIRTVSAAWPEIGNLTGLPARAFLLRAPLPVACGAVTAAAEIGPDMVGPLFLQAFVHNIVSAAVRAVPLGQTGGQQTIAALEGTVAALWRESRDCGPGDIGSAALMAEWSSLRHEAMDGRLFRS